MFADCRTADRKPCRQLTGAMRPLRQSLQEIAPSRIRESGECLVEFLRHANYVTSGLHISQELHQRFLLFRKTARCPTVR